MKHHHLWLRRMVGVTAFTFLATPALVAQTTGTVTGRITSSATSTAIEAARVHIVGTGLQVTSNRDGAYSIRGVNPGIVSVRVSTLGYGTEVKQVTVVNGQSVTVDFALTAAPYTLEELTTTAIGDTRKAELGNSVSTIQVSELAEQAPIKTLADLLKGRAPGVQVFSSTGTIGGGNGFGSGATTRCRCPTNRSISSTGSGSRVRLGPSRPASAARPRRE